MPRIAPEDKTPLLTVQFRLKADLNAKLNAYARFLDGSSPSYIVTQSLVAMLDGDKEFAAFLIANPEAAKSPAPSQAVRGRGRPKSVPTVPQATAA